jgi:hypothetical protein
MKIGNIFTSIAKTQTAQKIYKKVLDPKHDKFMNTQLPVIESAVISGMYIFSTAIQKNIDSDSKEALQWQNILSLLFSVGMAIPLNKKVAKLGDKIIKNLKPELMEDGHKVVDGLKVGLPILNSILISRFLVAVGLVPLSSKIREAIKERRTRKEGLDLRA